MADTLASGASARQARGGSNPPSPTNYLQLFQAPALANARKLEKLGCGNSRRGFVRLSDMNWGRLVVSTLVVATVMVVAPAEVALACSCAPAPSDEVALGGAEAVFAGMVVGRSDPNEGAAIIGSGDRITWTFEVDAVAKGEVGAQQEVVSARNGASCGFTFQERKRYLVFAYEGREDSLATDICTNTRRLAPSEELPFPAEEPAGPAAGGIPFDDAGGPDAGTILVSLLAIAAVAITAVYLLVRPGGPSSRSRS